MAIIVLSGVIIMGDPFAENKLMEYVGRIWGAYLLISVLVALFAYRKTIKQTMYEFFND